LWSGRKGKKQQFCCSRLKKGAVFRPGRRAPPYSIPSKGKSLENGNRGKGGKRGEFIHTIGPIVLVFRKREPRVVLQFPAGRRRCVGRKKISTRVVKKAGTPFPYRHVWAPADLGSKRKKERIFRVVGKGGLFWRPRKTHHHLCRGQVGFVIILGTKNGKGKMISAGSRS